MYCILKYYIAPKVLKSIIGHSEGVTLYISS